MIDVGPFKDGLVFYISKNLIGSQTFHHAKPGSWLCQQMAWAVPFLKWVMLSGLLRESFVFSPDEKVLFWHQTKILFSHLTKSYVFSTDKSFVFSIDKKSFVFSIDKKFCFYTDEKQYTFSFHKNQFSFIYSFAWILQNISLFGID